MPKGFDQDAKDRVVGLVEVRILAERIFDVGSVHVCGAQTGCLVAHGPIMDASSSTRRTSS